MANTTNVIIEVGDASVLKGVAMNKTINATTDKTVESKRIGRAFPARVFEWSIKRPTTMFPKTTKMTEIIGSHVKKSLAQTVMLSTSVMYLFK